MSDRKVKNNSLENKETLGRRLFIQIFPKSRFNEMDYLEMNAQEIAIFTVLGCFSHI